MDKYTLKLKQALFEMHDLIKNSKSVKESIVYFRQDEYIEFANFWNLPICYSGFDGNKVIIVNSELLDKKAK